MSTASTRAPFCNNTSATGIQPCTAAQCRAVCFLWSQAFTSPPCFKSKKPSRISQSISKRGGKPTKLVAETNYLDYIQSHVRKIVEGSPLEGVVPIPIGSRHGLPVSLHEAPELLEVAVGARGADVDNELGVRRGRTGVRVTAAMLGFGVNDHIDLRHVRTANEGSIGGLLAKNVEGSLKKSESEGEGDAVAEQMDQPPLPAKLGSMSKLVPPFRAIGFLETRPKEADLCRRSGNRTKSNSNGHRGMTSASKDWLPVGWFPSAPRRDRLVLWQQRQ